MTAHTSFLRLRKHTQATTLMSGVVGSLANTCLLEMLRIDDSQPGTASAMLRSTAPSVVRRCAGVPDERHVRHPEARLWMPDVGDSVHCHLEDIHRSGRRPLPGNLRMCHPFNSRGGPARLLRFVAVRPALEMRPRAPVPDPPAGHRCARCPPTAAPGPRRPPPWSLPCWHGSSHPGARSGTRPRPGSRPA